MFNLTKRFHSFTVKNSLSSKITSGALSGLSLR